MNFPIDEEKMRLAQQEFEKYFGPSEKIKTYVGRYGNETAIIVENHNRKAFYSKDDVELLKIINLTEE